MPIRKKHIDAIDDLDTRRHTRKKPGRRGWSHRRTNLVSNGARVSNSNDNELLEFRVLKYFRAIAEECGVSAACIRLNVSQPSLSEQIKNIEDVLGVQLLIREKSGVSLTSEGHLLFSGAVDLLDARDELVHMVKMMSDGVLAGSYSVYRAWLNPPTLLES